MLQQNRSVIDKSFMRKLWSAFKKLERKEERRNGDFESGKIEPQTRSSGWSRVLERHAKRIKS